MRARPTLAVVVTLAIAGCDRSPTDNMQPPAAPVDPMTAQAASTGCSSRCGYLIDVQPSGSSLVFRVTEDARLLGDHVDKEFNSTGVFSWSRARGTVSTPLGMPPGEAEARAGARNNWGQTVGTTYSNATAWEPNGTPVPLRDPATSRRIRGWGPSDINENSVIVGGGYLDGTPNNSRPFRWHYKDGFQFLVPDGVTGTAARVNDAGTIIGSYRQAGSEGPMTWFTWTSATGRRDMGPGEARAISENGHIVGVDGAGDGWMRTPQGEMVTLPKGWRPIDVNDWGEVLLRGTSEVVPPNTCVGAVWYKGYGLLRLTSPDPEIPWCNVVSINSWGDVAGHLLIGSNQPRRYPVVWTWKNNAYRYVAQ